MNLLWLTLPAVALAVAARRRPLGGAPVLTMGVLGFVALGNLLLAYRRVHWAAALLLALGIAVQAARMAAPHVEPAERWVRRGARWAALLLAVATAALFGGRWAGQRWAMAALPDGRAGAPNVLVLVLDTVRGFNLSLHGYERPTTPRLTRWAAEGARFDRAFATSSWTLPSHASMFTGRLPHELSTALTVPLDDTYPTLAEALRAEGYATGSFVANLSYCTWQYGLTRGFLHADSYPVTPSMFLWSSPLSRRLLTRPGVRRLLGFWEIPGRKRAATVSADFLAWAERVRGRPFFAFLNYYDAHQPVLPAAPFDTLFGPRPAPRPPEEELVHGMITDAEVRQRMAQYDGAIAYLDQQIDVLLTTLADRGLLDNTVVVITSDHGEHWGQTHPLLSHGNSLYRQLLQVPLVIRYPARIPGGTVVAEPVSLRDLPVTVLDLVGAGARGDFPGHSLVSHTDAARTGASVPPRPVLAGDTPRGTPGLLSLIAEGMHYIAGAESGEELYDLERDPRDAVNIAGTEAGRAVLPRLRFLMDSLARRPE